MIAAWPSPGLAQSTDEDIIEILRTAYGNGFCFASDVEDAEIDIGRYTLSWRRDWLDDDQPDLTAELIEAICFRGAYNFGYVYFLDDETDGLRPVHFAVPDVDIDYADDNSEVVESVDVTGFSAMATLINPDFDAETQTLTSYAKSRGLGDAFSAGRWVFDNGGFVLKGYVIDPTYNGEIDPVTVFGDPVVFE